MSSTAGNDTADDSMDEIKADPEQRPQGTSPPPFLGSHFEAGAEGKGNRLRSTHGQGSVGSQGLWGKGELGSWSERAHNLIAQETAISSQCCAATQ